eukprot:Awhi_evm1s2038
MKEKNATQQGRTNGKGLSQCPSGPSAPSSIINCPSIGSINHLSCQVEEITGYSVSNNNKYNHQRWKGWLLFLLTFILLATFNLTFMLLTLTLSDMGILPALKSLSIKYMTSM